MFTTTKFFKKSLLIVLMSITSLTLFACGKSNNQSVRINFNTSAYIEVVDSSVEDESDIECSYTESIDDINNDLAQVYESLKKDIESQGDIVEYTEEYMSVQSLYIYKIKFNDDKEHRIKYHNNFWDKYKEYNDCYTCIVRVENGGAPTYDTYDIDENTYFNVKGTSYIFYGSIDEEEQTLSENTV